MGCYVEGECLGAGFEDFQPLATAAECHELCINTDGCLFFTHYGDETDDFGCFAYRNCPEFSDAGCNDCISGEVDCAVRGTVRKDKYLTQPNTFQQTLIIKILCSASLV